MTGPVGPSVAAALLGVAAVVEAVARAGDDQGVPLYAVLVPLAMTVPVALVRSWPVAAAALSAVAGLLSLLATSQPPVSGLIALAILYFVAGRHSSLRTTAALVLPTALYVLVPVDRSYGLVMFGLTVAAAATGTGVRLREVSRKRAANEQTAAASMLEHIARGERARIARELHDVVAHHISMIALQAEAARLATPGMPAEGARRLTAIGDTARTALTEMRRLLGVLREDAEDAPTRQPQPGLRQLNDLLDEVRELGPGSVRLIVSGPVAQLDQGIELAAYRIVQEALTNARRHAPGAAVDVELCYGDDALLVRVRDNGPGPPGPDGGGHGLAGMRERASMAGGHVVAGAAPFAGFLVEAVLPTKTSETGGALA